MRIDLYTKTILTVIAILLAVIAFSGMLQPRRVSAAGTDFLVMCSSCSMGSDEGMLLEDRSTGDLWLYNGDALLGNGKPTKWGQINLPMGITRAK